MRGVLFYRLQQLLILLLHLVLLGWLIYCLQEMGTWPVERVLIHFVGMAIFGGLLIRGCAAWAKYHHKKH